MTTINALKVRNQFGAVLDMLEREHEPILIEKRKQVKAVLISYEDFLHRFIDKQAEEAKQEFLTKVATLRQASIAGTDPVADLRRLRGYPE